MSAAVKLAVAVVSVLTLPVVGSFIFSSCLPRAIRELYQPRAITQQKYVVISCIAFVDPFLLSLHLILHCAEVCLTIHDVHFRIL
jgi:hypothetical protein